MHGTCVLWWISPTLLLNNVTYIIVISAHIYYFAIPYGDPQPSLPYIINCFSIKCYFDIDRNY